MRAMMVEGEPSVQLYTCALTSVHTGPTPDALLARMYSLFTPPSVTLEGVAGTCVPCMGSLATSLPKLRPVMVTCCA